MTRHFQASSFNSAEKISRASPVNAASTIAPSLSMKVTVNATPLSDADDGRRDEACPRGYDGRGDDAGPAGESLAFDAALVSSHGDCVGSGDFHEIDVGPLAESRVVPQRGSQALDGKGDEIAGDEDDQVRHADFDRDGVAGKAFAEDRQRLAGQGEGREAQSHFLSGDLSRDRRPSGLEDQRLPRDQPPRDRVARRASRAVGAE